jgi:hypothetical protein
MSATQQTNNLAHHEGLGDQWKPIHDKRDLHRRQILAPAPHGRGAIDHRTPASEFLLPFL